MRKEARAISSRNFYTTENKVKEITEQTHNGIKRDKE